MTEGIGGDREQRPVTEGIDRSTSPWRGGGREELADAVRRIVAATVSAVAPPEVLDEAARRIGAVADQLEGGVPPPGPEPTSRFSDLRPGTEVSSDLAAAMPFDLVIGTCNPLALPVRVHAEPPKAVGIATFTAPYGGAPGMVHGAALAATFDIVLTAANVIAEGPGPTVQLKVRFRKPTRLDRECRFEGWVTRRTSRRTFSEGCLIQDGVVTVEAEGEFVDMDRSRIATLHRQGRATSPEG